MRFDALPKININVSCQPNINKSSKTSSLKIGIEGGKRENSDLPFFKGDNDNIDET